MELVYLVTTLTTEFIYTKEYVGQ